MEYNGGLEKAILRDSELLSEVNDAFCKSPHPLLAQKVVTRSASAAVSKIGADALVTRMSGIRHHWRGGLSHGQCTYTTMDIIGEGGLFHVNIVTQTLHTHTHTQTHTHTATPPLSVRS